MNKWHDEDVSDLIKAIIFAVVMYAGFWVIFTNLLCAVGFTTESWVPWVTSFMAVISEIVYFKWLSN